MTKKKAVPTPEPQEAPRVVSYNQNVSLRDKHLTLAHLLDLTFEALRREFPDDATVSIWTVHGETDIAIIGPAERQEFT